MFLYFMINLKIMRTFIACEIPEETKDIVVQIQNKIKDINASVVWVKKESMHITLRFLGEIQENEVKTVKECIQKVSEQNNRFDIFLENIKVFPSWSFPRVLWIGIKDPEQINKLAGNVEQELVKKGFQPQDKPFQAHLTIGRIKGLKNKESLQKIVLTLPLLNEKIGIDRIILFQSKITPTGPIHTRIFEAKLNQ